MRLLHKTLLTSLIDGADAPGCDNLAVEFGSFSILISSELHGVCCTEDSAPISSGQRPVIVVERWEGDLRVLVWGDINQEDPTHTISLEGALISNRKED